MKTTLIDIKLYYRLMKFITKFYFADLKLTGKSITIRKVLYKFEILQKTKGSVAAATYIKLCRLAITKYLSEEKIDIPFGISLDKDHLPSLLPNKVREGIKSGDKLLISWILTLLQISKLVRGDPKIVKTDTMVKESSYSETIPQYQIALAMNKMGLYRGKTQLK